MKKIIVLLVFILGVRTILASTVADCGNDQVVLPSDLVTLDGRTSFDTQGFPIVFWEWKLFYVDQDMIISVPLAVPGKSVASFIAPTQCGEYIVQLRVTSFAGFGVTWIHIFVEPPDSNYWQHKLPILWLHKSPITARPGKVCTVYGRAECQDGIAFSWWQLAGDQITWTIGAPWNSVARFQPDSPGIIVCRLDATGFCGLTSHILQVVCVTDGAKLRTIHPHTARSGQLIIIYGFDFAALTDNKVFFGNIQARVFSYYPKKSPYAPALLVQVPYGIKGKVPVIVKINGCKTSNAVMCNVN